VAIRRAESTEEDPIYTCATDEDTACRPAPRWERSTARRGDARSPPGLPLLDRAHGAAAGGKAGAGGPAVHVGAASRLEEGRFESDVGRPTWIDIFPPPPKTARGLCGRALRPSRAEAASWTCTSPSSRATCPSRLATSPGRGSSVSNSKSAIDQGATLG
jgi:hypothetical protein